MKERKEVVEKGGPGWEFTERVEAECSHMHMAMSRTRKAFRTGTMDEVRAITTLRSDCV